MKHYAKILISAVIMTFVATIAIAQTVVVHSDFNQDTIGESPASDLPGDPDGDYLGYAVDGGTIAVQASYRGLNEQPVVLTREEFGAFWIAFYVDPDLRDCEAFNISWRCVLSSYAEFCYVSYASPNQRVMGSVEFWPDGVMTANGPNTVLDATYQPQIPQLIEVRLDMVAGTVSVSVDGVPDPPAQDLSMNQTGADGLRVVNLNFGMRDNYTVALDDLHVTGDNCAGVANEATSWSAVKAMYR